MKQRPTAVVTGGGQGLGQATVRRFVAAGWQALILDTNAGPAQELQGELGDQIVQVIECDVSSTQSVDDAIREVVRHVDAVDCVVNNAGIVRPAPSHDTADSDWELLLGVHLGGTMRVSRACLPLLAGSAAPAVVNISSVCAQLGFPGRLSYNAAKAGIEAMTQTLAVEWGQLGIRVNAAAPGFIMTDNSRELYERGVADASARVEATPLMRLGKPQEVAEAVFWPGTSSSSFVTGQVLAVDGGYLVDVRTGPDPTCRSAQQQVEEATARLSGTAGLDARAVSNCDKYPEGNG